MTRIFAVLAASVALTGCMKSHIITQSDASPGATQVTKVHTLVYGLVSLNEIDASAMCGDSGVHSVSTLQTFVDSLVGGITGGIYGPVTVEVTCNS